MSRAADFAAWGWTRRRRAAGPRARPLPAALAVLAALAALAGAPGSAALAQGTAPSSSVAVAPAEATRTTIYDNGARKVTTPVVVTRVASVWEAQNSIIAMLGYGDKIVATTRLARDMPAFRKMLPGIERVPIAGAGAGDLNVEELVRLRPQVLFMAGSAAPAQEQQLRGAGIAIASFRANSLAALRDRITVTGQILGEDASARARQYQAYFDENIRRVRQALAQVPESRRVSVYHAVTTPLNSSGRPSLNQDWMDLAQVRNVAENWFGNGGAGAEVSVEQIIAADPDIIVAMRAGDAARIRTDARWRRLRAVANGRVYANPRGMFWWGRETSEVALQFLWLAKLAYPKEMQDVDMREETRRFYKVFYGYELSAAEVEEFLNPLSP